MLQSHLLLCWHDFYDVSVTVCNVTVMLPKYIVGVRPRYHSTKMYTSMKLDEADLIGGNLWGCNTQFLLFFDFMLFRKASEYDQEIPQSHTEDVSLFCCINDGVFRLAFPRIYLTGVAS